MGFYIPMDQLTNMIKAALGGSKGGSEDGGAPPNRPPAPKRPTPEPPVKEPAEPLNEAMRARMLQEISRVVKKDELIKS